MKHLESIIQWHTVNFLKQNKYIVLQIYKHTGFLRFSQFWLNISSQSYQTHNQQDQFSDTPDSLEVAYTNSLVKATFGSTTLRCQINKSTRLAFSDFSLPYLHFFHLTLFANSYSFIGHFFPPYSFMKFT